MRHISTTTAKRYDLPIPYAIPYNNGADESRDKEVLFDMRRRRALFSGSCLISSCSRCISGVAEVAAGAIAMGLGGYLAALPIAVVQRCEKK